MLFIVATPIGHLEDISLRALNTLRNADLIIGEERRVASTLLKKLNLPDKELYLLNEHSTERDLDELLELCKKYRVALISDCGTPSFYDPGYQLVHRCRLAKVPIHTLPGASSLMTLLSLVSQKVTQFYFAGFLPADSELRKKQYQHLSSQKEAIVLMDTPYRLQKLLGELQTFFASRSILLGLNLTQESELVLEGELKVITADLEKRQIEKAEFILLIYPGTKATEKSSPRFTRSTRTRR